MRCFVGSVLDPIDQRKLSELDFDVDATAIRWVKPHKYHLTLEFLGNDVTHSDLDEGWRKVAEWREAFPISCRKVSLSGFPSAQRARVLVTLLHSEGRLEALRPTHRAFRPHITLGYARGAFVAVPPQSANVDLTIPAPSLIKSERGRYEILDPKAR